MRTIKFRGKRLDGEWVYGGFHEHTKRQICPIGDELTNKDICSLIIQSGFADWNMPKPIIAFEVILESVGQWTGLVDRHGKEIFEGDIIYGENYLFPVYDFRKMAVTWNEKSGGFDMDIFDQENIEIIGNIHDNPELMEVE